VRPSTLPGGTAAFTIHVGPYDQIGAAYGAIQEYAKVNGLNLAGNDVGVLSHRPEEPDP